MFDALSAWEINILLWIQNNVRHDAMTWFWRFMSFLGEVGWFFILVTVLLLIYKNTRMKASITALSMLLAFLINNLAIKNVAARTRPYIFCDQLHILGTVPADYSFPSGHTCFSFACAFVIYKLFPKRYGVPVIVLASLIALSRLYLGAHYPSDVLGGVIIAFITSRIALFIKARFIDKKVTE